MGQPYVGEIRIFAGSFAPAGWLFCDGSLIPISENETLFQLIGTTYGGDGQTTFQLPDLRGRIPIHFGNDGSGNTYQIGENGGAEQVTLTIQQCPQHNHSFLATTASPSTSNPQGAELATPVGNIYTTLTGMNTLVTMSAQSVAPAGGSQPHENMQPYLGVNFIIAQFGVFPSPT